jgi:DNA end-binding protein Ku
MARRPNWKGHLKLSLISCSALYLATTLDERIRFNIINRKTGNRMRNDIVDAETTDKPVEPEDRVKGYQFEKNQYVLVEEDELDNVALESTHTLESAGGDRRRRVTSRRKSGMRAKNAPPRKKVRRTS